MTIGDVYVVDCDVKGLPDIVFTIGGHEYPVPSKEYIIDVSQQQLTHT